MKLTQTITISVRAGLTIERIGQLREAGISTAVIAQHLTDTSRHGYVYTEADIVGYAKLYDDAKSAVGITKRQTEALLKDQELSNMDLQPA